MLTPLAPGVYAWLADKPGLGCTNAGVVVDEDGITVIDTLMVRSQWEPFAEAVSSLGFPIRRVVLTTSHVEFVGGTLGFWPAAIYGSPQTSEHLEQPPNLEAYQHFMPAFASEFADFATSPVSHVVGAPVTLTPAVAVHPLPGQTAGNLVVHVAGANVVFGGGLVAFEVTPLAFQGDPRTWINSLETVAGFGAMVVPGHGPLGSPSDIESVIGYLQAVIDAEGDAAKVPSGPWDAWVDRHLDAINVERAALLAAGDDRIPSSMLAAIGMA